MANTSPSEPLTAWPTHAHSPPQHYNQSNTMKTDNITIGRDPALTLFVMRGIAERNERIARKKAILQRIKSILTFKKP